MLALEPSTPPPPETLKSPRKNPILSNRSTVSRTNRSPTNRSPTNRFTSPVPPSTPSDCSQAALLRKVGNGYQKTVILDLKFFVCNFFDLDFHFFDLLLFALARQAPDGWAELMRMEAVLKMSSHV